MKLYQVRKPYLIILSVISIFAVIELLTLYQEIISKVKWLYGVVISPFCKAGEICSFLEGLRGLSPVISWGLEKWFFILRILSLPILLSFVVRTRHRIAYAQWWIRMNAYSFGVVIILVLLSKFTLGELMFSGKQLLIISLQIVFVLWFARYL